MCNFYVCLNSWRSREGSQSHVPRPHTQTRSKEEDRKFSFLSLDCLRILCHSYFHEVLWGPDTSWISVLVWKGPTHRRVSGANSWVIKKSHLPHLHPQSGSAHIPATSLISSSLPRNTAAPPLSIPVLSCLLDVSGKEDGRQNCRPQQGASFTCAMESTPRKPGAERGWVPFWMLATVEANQSSGHKQKKLASLPWVRTSRRGQGSSSFNGYIIGFLQERLTPPAVSLQCRLEVPKEDGVSGSSTYIWTSRFQIKHDPLSGWCRKEADAAFFAPAASTFLL